MSELKAFESERIYWAVEQVERVAGDIDNLHLDDNLFYIKSEADKEIEFWKKESHEHYERWFSLNKQYEGWFDKVMRCERAERELRHQKYKRCINMVDKCGHAVSRYLAEGRLYKIDSITAEGERRNELLEQVDDCEKKATFYDRWARRWSEIADKFELGNQRL